MTLEQLKSNIKWWESKRWIYNILVGLAGGLGLFKMLTATTYDWSYCDTIAIIIWGIGANLFYSLGTLLELFDWYYLNNRLRLQRFRELFFGFRYCLWLPIHLWKCANLFYWFGILVSKFTYVNRRILFEQFAHDLAIKPIQ